MKNDMRKGLLFGAILGVAALWRSGDADLGSVIATIGAGMIVGYGLVRFLRWRWKR